MEGCNGKAAGPGCVDGQAAGATGGGRGRESGARLFAGHGWGFSFPAASQPADVIAPLSPCLHCLRRQGAERRRRRRSPSQREEERQPRSCSSVEGAQAQRCVLAHFPHRRCPFDRHPIAASSARPTSCPKPRPSAMLRARRSTSPLCGPQPPSSRPRWRQNPLRHPLSPLQPRWATPTRSPFPRTGRLWSRTRAAVSTRELRQGYDGRCTPVRMAVSPSSAGGACGSEGRCQGPALEFGRARGGQLRRTGWGCSFSRSRPRLLWRVRATPRPRGPLLQWRSPFPDAILAAITGRSSGSPATPAVQPRWRCPRLSPPGLPTAPPVWSWHTSHHSMP